jgi:hypothetical protein
MMAKLENLIQRPDGSEVKIVAQACFGLDQKFSADVFVLGRDSANHDWRVLSDRPHPDWRRMSVDEYIKRGRSEVLQAVTHGQILKTAQALRTSLGL